MSTFAHALGWFCGGMLFTLFVCVWIADRAQSILEEKMRRSIEMRQRAIDNLQRRMRKGAALFEVCSRRINFAPPHEHLAADFRNVARNYVAWAEADLDCLAREPGTCPPTCACKQTEVAP